MAEITPYVPALNGEEIIQDACGALAEKLRTDCNLRPIDGYAGGYKAKISIHIEAYGLDAAAIDYDVEVNAVPPPTGDETFDRENPDTVIDTEVDIPLEEDLSLVRERSEQTTPNFESNPEITEEGPVGQPQKRKYTRRLKALAMATGGATGEMDE